MDQPRNGRGALDLLLRLTMLRSRQRGGGSLAELGYSLAVALIAAFVLLLGVGALASRGQLGFIGQAFQVQNRQARDVAEAAIAQFADALNREENRYLLVAETPANWTNGFDNRNICTAFDENQELAGDVENPAPVDATVVARFRQGNAFQPLFRPTGDDDPDPSRRFRVERVEYLPANRNEDGYSQTKLDVNGNVTQAGTRDLLLSGSTRALIRVTVIGQVEQNGRVSQARVAREFEVVPKCCKRSFGANAAQRWGRDDAPCELEIPDPPGRAQFFIGLNGGVVQGSNNVPDIKDQNNKDISQAACWAGFPEDGADAGTALDTNIDPETDLASCLAGELFLGQGDGDTESEEYLGVSFVRTNFDVVLPEYARDNPSLADEPWLSENPAPPPATKEGQWFSYNIGHETVDTGNTSRYIYYDQSKGSLQYCKSSTCAPLAVSGTKDVCYERVDIDLGANPPRPYAEVNCRLSKLDIGNTTLIIDTSNARINFFFDEGSPATDYIAVKGNSELVRVHCRQLDSNTYVQYDNNNRCTNILEWNSPSDPAGDFQSLCTVNGSKCGLDADNLDYFDTSELLNIYATGTGKINLRGTTAALSFNVYAPFSDVKLNGNPDFHGRLVINGLDVRGATVTLRVLNTPPSGGVITGLTRVENLWDFVARSFTQSSGFGL